MEAPLLASQRREELIARLHRDGQVHVKQLAHDFDITPETVRRDLDALERSGIARRVHGGAVAASRVSLNEPDLVDRAVTNAIRKRRIAELACQRLLSSGATSILLDAGSTTGAMAAELVEAWPQRNAPRLIVTTHSPAIAQALAAHQSIETHTLGGRIRNVTGAAVGAQTVLAINNLRPDIVVLGTNGLDSSGLSTPDPEEAAVKEALAAAGRRLAVLADGTKFEKTFLCRFAPLKQVDVLISDEEPGEELAESLHEADCEVYVA